MLSVTIDLSRCTGHGRCYAVAPELFESDDDGYGRPLAEQFADNFAEQAQLAVRNCPEDAITISDKDAT